MLNVVLQPNIILNLVVDIFKVVFLMITTPWKQGHFVHLSLVILFTKFREFRIILLTIAVIYCINTPEILISLQNYNCYSDEQK